MGAVTGEFRRGLGCVVLVFGPLCNAAGALAQGFPPSPPPVYSVVDANGVNLVTGGFNVSTQDVSIGPAGADSLSYSRSFLATGTVVQTGWTDNFIGTISGGSSPVTVSFGKNSENFTLSGGVYTNAQGGGSTLSYDGVSTYTYTSAAGVVWVVSTALGGVWGPPTWATNGRPVSATFPDGRVVNFTYQTISVCIGTCPGPMITASRLQSVNNNAGWQMKIDYAFNSASTTNDLVNWTTISKVTGINNAYDYCDPFTTCSSFSTTYPSASYAIHSGSPTTSTVTDTLGRQTTYTYNSSGQITAISRPSGFTTSITYNASGQVATVANGVGTWSYAYTTPGGVPTTTVTDPLGHAMVATGVTNGIGAPTGQLATVTDGLSRVTQYFYDSSSRLQKITRPEGDQIQYTYDARGNVTQTTRTPSFGTPASLSTYASFDSTCTYPAKCNKPNTTTDSQTQGNVTNYAYDNTHGVLLSVTPPVPAAGLVQPQTRFSYASKYAWYKNSSGATVQASTPIFELISISACQMNAATVCPGTADEVRRVLDYGAGSSMTPNNLALLSDKVRTGDASLSATTSYTYDQVGNRLTVQAPLGAAQTTLSIYDSQRQLSGVIGPDPDAAGPLLFPAVRYTYNLDGRTTLVEQGTTTAQSVSAFASFASLQNQAATYDTAGRVSQTTFTGNNFTYRMAQYAFDNANNLTCTAVRLAPSNFGAEPASACAQGPYSSYGPDQITYNTYDAANEFTQLTIGYGTPAQANYAALSYTPNGLVQTVLDANNNLTTTLYDGYDRVTKVEYPKPPPPGQSDPSDYEGYTYDANSNILSRSLRSGETFTYSYDNLNRLSESTHPAGGETKFYSYDLLNRGLYVHFSSAGGPGIDNTWDGLSRLTTTTNSTTSPSRTLSYQYDLDGNRTRVTWPDSLYVIYVYDYLNRMIQVEENGATSGVGVLATYSYNDLGQMTNIARAGGAGASTVAYYDPASRLGTLKQIFTPSANNVTWGFNYNGADQLVKRTSTNDAYSFHPSPLSNTYVANELNQYTSVGGVNYNYIDTDGASRGNLTSDGVSTFHYDLENHLISAASAQTSVTLTYDPLGRLQTSTAGSATTTFLYDGNNLVGEYDSSGNILNRYVFGPGVDDPVVWYQGAGTANRNWLHMDNQNSAVAWSNSSGALVGSRGYGPYGDPSTWTGPRFAYTGQLMIPEAQLYHYKARVYDPAIGRFLQTDPVGYAADVNLYAYVGNSPIGRLDPSGTQQCPNNCLLDLPTVSGLTSVGTGPISGPSSVEAGNETNTGSMIPTGIPSFGDPNTEFALNSLTGKTGTCPSASDTPDQGAAAAAQAGATRTLTEQNWNDFGWLEDALAQDESDLAEAQPFANVLGPLANPWVGLGIPAMGATVAASRGAQFGAAAAGAAAGRVVALASGVGFAFAFGVGATAVADVAALKKDIAAIKARLEQLKQCNNGQG